MTDACFGYISEVEVFFLSKWYAKLILRALKEMEVGAEMVFHEPKIVMLSSEHYLRVGPKEKAVAYDPLAEFHGVDHLVLLKTQGGTRIWSLVIETRMHQRVVRLVPLLPAPSEDSWPIQVCIPDTVSLAPHSHGGEAMRFMKALGEVLLEIINTE